MNCLRHLSAAAAIVLASSRLLAGENVDAAGTEGAVTAVAESAAEEPDEPAPKPSPIYIEGRGFDFRTSDGLFDFAIGANLQLRFSYIDEEAVGEATEFRLRRLKLYMTGFLFDPRLTYRFQLAFENVNSARLLDDAWMAWKFQDLLQVQAGQSKTPYGRQELISDANLAFAERSIAIDAFKPNRDIGVMMTGNSKDAVFQYSAGVFGGVGQSTLRTSSHAMPIARVVWSTFGVRRFVEADIERKPSLRLSVGADGFSNTLRKISATEFDSTTASYASDTGWLGQNIGLFQTGEEVEIGSGSVDFQVAWCGFTLQGEYFVGHALGELSGVNLNSRGYYIETGAMVLPRLGLAARYSSVDGNRSVTRDQESEVNGAATWYFRKYNAMILLEYSTFHRQRPGVPANDRFLRIQAQLAM